MKKATLSDSTRDYLIVLGEFEDSATKFLNLLKREWGEDNANEMYNESFADSLKGIRDSILKALSEKIIMSIGESNPTSL